MFSYLKPLLKDWCDKRAYLISEKLDKPAVTAIWEDLQSPVAFPSWESERFLFTVQKPRTPTYSLQTSRSHTETQDLCLSATIWKEG